MLIIQNSCCIIQCLHQNANHIITIGIKVQSQFDLSYWDKILRQRHCKLNTMPLWG